MDEVLVLIDIGSTFTKITAVNLSAVEVMAKSNAPTTPDDVSIGLENGLAGLGLSEETIMTSRKLACSSAAGGAAHGGDRFGAGFDGQSGKTGCSRRRGPRFAYLFVSAYG